MPATDPLQSIRDAISHLEELSAPVEGQIREIRADADKRITELEAQVADQRIELTRWRRALARAEGKAPQGDASPAGSRSRQPLAVTDDALKLVLEGREDGLSASEIRAALDIDDAVPSAKMTRILGDAVSRGVVKRTGERRATRYLSA